MVLINNLTIDEINAALLHLQRARTEVVGGTKGSTVQNITISNKGGGSTVDYAPTITALSKRIDKNTDDIESVEGEIDKIQETLEQLSDNGISSMTFDPISRQLQINTQDGEVYSCNITSESITLNFDATTNKLTLYMGEQTQEVTLPYINANEKGSANGVATLDSSGRVPYSQLPESAMEFLGQWNASTNTPHLQDGTGTNGDFYVCNVGGTVTFGTGNTQTFVPNDRVIYNGATSQWIKLPAGQVSSVNGMSGDVTLTATDIEYSTGVSIKAKIDANAVQADWNVSDTTSLAYIKNKPTIPASQIQADWTCTCTTSKAYIKNKPTLATVATSGSYDDLSDKPTIPTNIIKAVCTNGFWGLANPNGADNSWIRTTTQGIIPYQSGGANAGHQSIGANSWYFANAYIQNIYGTTITANGYQLKRYYELDLSSLSTSNFYPITFPATDLELDCEIHSPNLGGGAAYNQNYIHFKLIAQGWTDTPKRLVIEQYAVYDANEITIGSIGMGKRSGQNCVWVRGGMKYRFYSNQTPTLHSIDYTWDSQTFTVGTNKTGGTNVNVTIAWEANGVNSATFPNILYAGQFRGPVVDTGNGCGITFAYSKAGLSSNPTWLAAWNGYELRAVSPSVVHVACADSATSASKASFLDLGCDCSDYWWDIPAFLTTGTCTAALKACCVNNKMKYQLSTGTLRVNCIDLQCPGGIPSLIGFEEIACYPGGRLYRLGCSSIYRFKNELTCTVGCNLYDSIAAALQTAFGYNIWTDHEYGVGAIGSRCFCANGCFYRCTITGVHVSCNWVTICGLYNCVEASRTQTSCVYSGCLDFIFLGK